MRWCFFYVQIKNGWSSVDIAAYVMYNIIQKLMRKDNVNMEWLFARTHMWTYRCVANLCSETAGFMVYIYNLIFCMLNKLKVKNTFVCYHMYTYNVQLSFALSIKSNTINNHTNIAFAFTRHTFIIMSLL